ncbi:condensation domain-containing protein, partial [Dactylosporangium sp. NPDC049140]|uniref:condensation domain-containing protein n=1 Tax=Dactylosporangium sp. NPDC049140 TaxID=3155647 RepID=UPI0033D8CA4A
MTASAFELLNELSGRGVRLYLADGQLRAVAAGHAMTDEVRRLVRSHRDELIAALRERDAGASQPITAVDRDQPLPLSFAQQRLWFLDRLQPGSLEYNVPMRLPFGRDLAVDTLRHALGALVERHEVLRTRLVTADDGTPHQVVDPPAPFDLPIVDLSGEPDPAAAAEAWLAADGRAPFDLAAGPLFRATLVRTGPDEQILAIAKHHAVSDEWSAGILRRELAALYAGEDLPPLPIQYADFAAWQRTWLTGAVLDSQLDYWRSRLSGAPVLDLPTDRPRPPVRSSDGALIEFAIPDDVTEALRA